MPSLRVLLMCGVLCLSTVEIAAAVSTQDLLRPNEVEDVRISPSGMRIAFLKRGKQSEKDFVVLERNGNDFSTIFITRMASNQSIQSYQWLAEDYLALNYSRSDEALQQLSIANIPRQTVTVLEPAANVIKAHWGDDDHALISTSIGCSVSESVAAGRCLVSLNLRNSGRNTVAPFVRLLPVGFMVFSEADIYVRGYDEQRVERAMKLNVETNSWTSIEPATLAQVANAQQDKLRIVTTTRIPAGSRMVGLEGQSPVGFSSPAPQRGFTSLRAEFDGLEVALETRFNGEYATLDQLSNDLQHGLIRVDSLQKPTQYLLWDRNGDLTRLDIFNSKLQGQTLGKTRVEARWVSGLSMAVTLPPSGTAITSVVIAPMLAPEALVAQAPTAFDGEFHAFALNGVVYVSVLLATPNRFADGDAATRWRQTTHQTVQKVIDAASQEFLQGAPVCLYAESYLASMLLSDASFDKLGCIAALNAPLLPEKLSERIKLGEYAQMKLSPSTLEREVRGAFALPDGSLSQPAQQVGVLPARVMLAYELTEPLFEVFGRQSNAFRSAVKKSGKQLVYEAPMSDKEDKSAYEARVLNRIIEFVAATNQSK